MWHRRGELFIILFLSFQPLTYNFGSQIIISMFSHVGSGVTALISHLSRIAGQSYPDLIASPQVLQNRSIQSTTFSIIPGKGCARVKPRTLSCYNMLNCGFIYGQGHGYHFHGNILRVWTSAVDESPSKLRAIRDTRIVQRGTRQLLILITEPPKKMIFRARFATG